MTKTNEDLTNLEARENYAFSERENYVSYPLTKPTKPYLWKQTKTNLIKSCLLCDNQIQVKYIPPKKRYSLKNNWGYWTGKETFKDKYACNSCLVNIHQGGIVNWVNDSEKADIFYTYLSRKTFLN